MSWYSFSASNDEKEVGEYPQTDMMGPNYDLNAPNSVWNISNLKKLTFQPNLEYFILCKKAKVTDIISTATINARGFLVSEKLKNILSKFQLAEHCYYPAKLIHKKNIINNFFWLHFIKDNSHDIDFEHSTFKFMHPLPFSEQILLN